MAGELQKLIAATSNLQEQLQDAVKKLQDNSYHQSSIKGGTTSSSNTCNISIIGCSSGSGHTQEISSTGNSSGLSSRRVVWNPMNVFHNKRKTGPNSKSSKRKQPRVSTWTHIFVCLAYTTQDLIPDSEERAKLLMAGIGEKKIAFNLDSDAQDIHYELFSQFPKIRKGGGFELLRAQEVGRKLLTLIAVPKSGYTCSVLYLKTVVHNAKIYMYIRPLQRDLSLEPVDDELGIVLGVPKEECLRCNEMILVTDLPEHLITCEERGKYDESVESVPKLLSNCNIK